VFIAAIHKMLLIWGIEPLKEFLLPNTGSTGRLRLSARRR
jgi:hypothetical protein